MLELAFHAHATIAVIEALHGLYQVYKKNHSKQFASLHLLFKALYFEVWLINGIILKENSLAFPGYIGLIVCSLLIYLSLLRKWEYMVYEFTVIMNTAWHMRQAVDDDLLIGCYLVSFLLTFSPFYQVFQAVKQRDDSYLSMNSVILGSLEATFFFIFALNSDQTIVLGTIALLRLAINIFTWFILTRTSKNWDQDDKKTK